MQPHLIAERYELVEVLGRGGMAQVWRARDLRLDRAVAVKILDRHASGEADAAARFEREAHAAARISHPNIVATYDYGTENDQPYLVMELVDGRSLQDLLATGPLPVADAVRIAGQTCAALDAAHRAGVIHRDIKPSNVIIAADGTVKVLDFGVARVRDALSADLTRTATVIGTSTYMAPEQASGGTVDERTDLYALGCLMYATLTGAPPFTGDNPMNVLYQHIHATPRPVREQRPDVPAELDRLIGSLLAKDPAARPPSAAAVQAALPDVTGDTDRTVRLVGAPTPIADTAVLPAQRRPRRRLWAAVLAGAAVVLAALLLVPWLLGGDDSPDTRAETTAPAASSTPADRTSRTPTQQPPATDPTSRIDQLRTLIGAKERAGDLESGDGRKLRKDLDKVDEEYQEGKTEDASKHAAELRSRLDELAGEGKIDDPTYRQLGAATDRLTDALPATDDEADDEGDDPGKGDKNEDKGKGKGKDKKP